MSELKKFISGLAFPVTLSLELLGAGLVLLWLTRRQKAGKALVTVGVVLLLLLSQAGLANLLLGSLEFRYPALQKPEELSTRAPGHPTRWVVVLGGGYSKDERLPLSARPSGPSLARLMEGIRVQKKLPGSRLLLSVGPGREADELAELARTLGVNPGDLSLEQGAQDTDDEAALTQRLVGADGLVLVTSASHMPRALALFRKRGLDAVPAPTDYLAVDPDWSKPSAWLPSPEGLLKSTRACHEYLGLVWAKLRGKI